GVDLIVEARVSALVLALKRAESDARGVWEDQPLPDHRDARLPLRHLVVVFPDRLRAGWDQQPRARRGVVNVLRDLGDDRLARDVAVDTANHRGGDRGALHDHVGRRRVQDRCVQRVVDVDVTVSEEALLLELGAGVDAPGDNGLTAEAAIAWDALVAA